MLKLRRPVTWSAGYVVLAIVLASSATAATLVIEREDQVGTGTIGGRAVADGSLTNADILNGSLSGADLHDATIGGTKIASGQITGSHLLDSAVASIDIANGTITGSDIAQSTINGGNIVNGTVTGGDLAASAVSGATVLNGTLTGADVQDSSLYSIDVANSSLTGTDVKDSSLTSSDIFREPWRIVGSAGQPAFHQVGCGSGYVCEWRTYVPGDAMNSYTRTGMTAFRKDAMGVVHLRLGACWTSRLSVSAVGSGACAWDSHGADRRLFYLPVGYRPSINLAFAFRGDNGIGNPGSILIGSGGSVINVGGCGCTMDAVIPQMEISFIADS